MVAKKEDEKENGKPGTSKSPDFITKHEDYEEELRKNRPTVVLHSQKMKQLKDLLLAEKLNTHAISLHLTAQSQVANFLQKNCRLFAKFLCRYKWVRRVEATRRTLRIGRSAPDETKRAPIKTETATRRL